MARQILENVEFQNNLDWFHVETQIRKEVHGLLMPFQDAMKESKQISAARFRDVDGLLDRMQVVEESCRIEDGGLPRKRNKFSILEELILQYRVELQEQMSDFAH